ncbi:DUF4199 domain-containing protein [Chitinophagaceae bacterium 26-R-25]|nr:DUF4199 domain-containing protein [Chitinophagaceae bacterium 26-R-25]
MKTKNAHLLSGLIIGIAVIIAYLLISYTSLKNNAAVSFLPALVLFVSAALNVVNYSRKIGEPLSFGNAFAFGFKSIAVASVIMIAYSVFSVTVLFPEMKEDAVKATIEALKQQGNTLPADTEKTARDSVNKGYIPIAISSALISTLVTGAIGSALGAALRKKNS